MASCSLTNNLLVSQLFFFEKGHGLTPSDNLVRFWGWRENAAEVQKDQAELSQRAKEGKPLYGESQLDPYLQGVAARNSTWSQLKLHAFPW